jgi:hippurate hydrolase
MLGAGHCIVALQSLVARNVDPLDSAVVSVTVAEAGEAQNQVPARAGLKGTMRFLRDRTGDALEEGIRRIADGVATCFQLRAEVSVRRGVAVTANHPAERELAADAAGAVTSVRRDLPPAMTGEDFSWLLQEAPGAFVWIGNGSAEGGRELHNPRYDFNDDILPVASGWLAEVAKRALAAPG